MPSVVARRTWLLLTCVACGDSVAGVTDGGESAQAAGDAGVAVVDAGGPGGAADEAGAQPDLPGELDSHYVFPCLGEREPTGAATFEAVYVEVFCQAGCASPYCHGSRGTWGDLDLSSIEGAYRELVNAPVGDDIPVGGLPTCRGSELLRVVPYAPEESLLYLKVSGVPPCGSAMPPAESKRSPLDAQQLDHVRRWIEAGAPLQDP